MDPYPSACICSAYVSGGHCDIMTPSTIWAEDFVLKEAFVATFRYFRLELPDLVDIMDLIL